MGAQSQPSVESLHLALTFISIVMSTKIDEPKGLEERCLQDPLLLELAAIAP